MFYVSYVEGIQMYRTGPFNTWEEAEAECNRLVSLGKNQVAIESVR